MLNILIIKVSTGDLNLAVEHITPEDLEFHVLWHVSGFCCGLQIYTLDIFLRPLKVGSRDGWISEFQTSKGLINSEALFQNVRTGGVPQCKKFK